MTATYRGAPLLKPPVWTWEVPAYFFVGGLAGAAAIIAAVAQFSGDDMGMLARDAKWIAAIGGLISPLLLISDLGRPSRFLNMLRVFKLRSPMSVGAWTLVIFSNAALASLLPLGVVADVATGMAALTGAVLATYTGVLIGATVIPVWSRNVDLLPIHFGASSLGAAVATLELLGHRTVAMNALGMVAAAVETVMMLILMRRGSPAGRLMLTAESLSGPLPLVLRALSVMVPAVRVAASAAAITGSLLTRFAWLGAGRRSVVRLNPS